MQQKILKGCSLGENLCWKVIRWALSSGNVFQAATAAFLGWMTIPLGREEDAAESQPLEIPIEDDDAFYCGGNLFSSAASTHASDAPNFECITPEPEEQGEIIFSERVENAERIFLRWLKTEELPFVEWVKSDDQSPVDEYEEKLLKTGGLRLSEYEANWQELKGELDRAEGELDRAEVLKAWRASEAKAFNTQMTGGHLTRLLPRHREEFEQDYKKKGSDLEVVQWLQQQLKLRRGFPGSTPLNLRKHAITYYNGNSLHGSAEDLTFAVNEVEKQSRKTTARASLRTSKRSRRGRRRRHHRWPTLNGETEKRKPATFVERLALAKTTAEEAMKASRGVARLAAETSPDSRNEALLAFLERLLAMESAFFEALAEAQLGFDRWRKELETSFLKGLTEAQLGFDRWRKTRVPETTAHSRRLSTDVTTGGQL